MSLSPSRPLLGCIADDFTGATDLANMLVRGGMRTVQSIGIPTAEMAASLDADAIVIALKSRTTPATEAVAESLAALQWLREQGCEQIFFKYCSTFDSTAAGNIGQVSEALLAKLGSDFTLACPAFPENGRTIFRGHLFVQDQLLSESGMQHHPLTPMTDANLVRVLQSQTQLKVGLLRYDSIAKGVEGVRSKIAELRADGVKMAIADALSDADLYTLGEACADLPLLTGGSGWPWACRGISAKRANCEPSTRPNSNLSPAAKWCWRAARRSRPMDRSRRGLKPSALPCASILWNWLQASRWLNRRWSSRAKLIKPF